MASGSFTGTTANANISSLIRWESETNTATNTSSLTVTLYLSRTNTGFTTEGTGTFSLVIDGTTYTDTGVHLAISYNSNTVAITRTVTIAHNSDGSRKVAISASGSLPPSSLTSVNCSGTATLDTIPRESSVSCVSSAELGSSVKITINRASSKFTHELKYTFAGETKTFATAAGKSATLVTALSWASKIPKATSGKCTITCTTKDASGNTVGNATTATVTLTVPADVKVTVSSGWATIAPYSKTETVNGWGIYIKSLTYAKATINTDKISYTNAYGATISGYTLSISGQTTTNGSATETTLQQLNSVVGNDITVTLTMKDTRGRTNKITQKIDVEDYVHPTASGIRIYRSDASGAPSLTGTMLTAYAVGSYANWIGQNALTLTVSGDGITTQTIPSGTNKVLSGTVAVDSSYALTLTANDSAGNQSTYSVPIGTAKATLHAPDGGRGIALGKYYDANLGDDLLQVGYTAQFDAMVKSSHATLPFRHQHPTSGKDIGLGVGSGGESRGIYDFSSGQTGWVVSTNNNSNTSLRFDNTHSALYGVNNVLWSGAWLGENGTTISLSKAVSAQAHGIALIFSGYSSSTARNYHFTTHLVPKFFVATHGGKGMDFLMASHAGFEVIGSKYFYISDSVIEGNDQNTRAATVNGVTFNNAYFVLRYVIGY